MAERLFLNYVLCYLSSARNTTKKDYIVMNAVAFYASEVISKAKTEIFKICDERPVARKACISHPNPSTWDIEDILELIERKLIDQVALPTFVARGHRSMPPVGFEVVAPVVVSLRGELSALRIELRELENTIQRNNLKSPEPDISVTIQHSSSYAYVSR